MPSAVSPPNSPAATGSPPPPVRPDLRRLLPAPALRTLDNGLRVCVLPTRRAPLVTSALVYRAGTRHELPATGGVAHFLEHMMFKGSENYGPGEVDAVTRSLGGSNNAYTSHDATLYYFSFAADRWQHGLDLERDRMRGLRLEPREVDAERQVILEEIAMYEGEPWDALDQALRRALFTPEHPYGRPVLGDRETLERIDAGVLGDFHHRYYRPSNAALAVVGDVDAEAAFDAVAAHFADLPAGGPSSDASAETGDVPSSSAARSLERLERRQGELARLCLGLRGPATDHPDHPALRLLLGIFASGRASRLHRDLVDEGEMCVWVSADVEDAVHPASIGVSCEVLPQVEPDQVEQAVLDGLESLRRRPPQGDEIERAKQIVVADWLFGHERVDQQAFLLANALALYDTDHPFRYLERLLTTDRDDLARVAERWLRPERGGVMAWSLPNGDDAA